MSLVSPLIGFGLRQVIGDGVENVVEAVQQRFRDHSQTLPKALARANDRTWQAIAVALAGDGFIDRVKVFFASGDDKGVREQVQFFLKSNAISFDGARQDCLDELKQLRKSGLLSTEECPAATVASLAAGFRRYVDGQPLIEGARRAVDQVADALTTDYPNLSKLLHTPTLAGPPLLAAAFAYFFRRQVEMDEELAHGLFFDGLKQLSSAQAKAFGEVGKALSTLGEQFDILFEHLERIEAVAVQTQAVVVATHGTVLDLQAEIQRLGGLHRANAEEVRALLGQVQQQLGQIGIQRGAVRSQHSLSIREEDEPCAVKVWEPRPGDIFAVGLGQGVEMKLAWIPPGSFLMGSPPSEAEREDDEVQHRVTVAKGFFLGVYPVTQGQWKAVMGSNPSRFKGADLPVEQVSQEDCVDFCWKLSERTRNRFRLPTEAEWEYACRAGTTTPFHFGTTLSTDQANYDGNQTLEQGKQGVYREETTPVGTFPPNAWSLYDMHGNVWEWCSDFYPTKEKGAARVVRGGSWFSPLRKCRSAYRGKDSPNTRDDISGCRVVLCLD